MASGGSGCVYFSGIELMWTTVAFGLVGELNKCI